MFKAWSGDFKYLVTTKQKSSVMGKLPQKPPTHIKSFIKDGALSRLRIQIHWKHQTQLNSGVRQKKPQWKRFTTLGQQRKRKTAGGASMHEH